jgi:capsular polysaccharide transport system permease protein
MLRRAASTRSSGRTFSRSSRPSRSRRAPGLPQTVPSRSLPEVPKKPPKAPPADPRARSPRSSATSRGGGAAGLDARRAARGLRAPADDRVGYYFYAVATPMYATKSEFVIQQADGAPRAAWAACSAGGPGRQPGFDHRPELPPVARIDAAAGGGHRLQGAFQPALHRPDPAARPGRDDGRGLSPLRPSREDRLRSHGGHREDGGHRGRSRGQRGLQPGAHHLCRGAGGQPQPAAARGPDEGATESFREAEAKMEAAQERVLVLQEQLGVLDPHSESASVMGQISPSRRSSPKSGSSSSSFSTTRRPTRRACGRARATSRGSRTADRELRAPAHGSERGARRSPACRPNCGWRRSISRRGR